MTDPNASAAAEPRNANIRVPMRQVHLDFHTSADFGEIGQSFDADQFGRTMAEASVASVNVFAKCHHGFSYYPTEVGTQHPGLDFDLLGEQIEGLHRHGVRAPIYLSVLWDDLAGEQESGWIAVDRAGRSMIRRPLSADTPLRDQIGWSTMDIASDYADYVRDQVDELCRRYPVDGFWFDIVWPQPSYSPAAVRRMRLAGVDIADENAVLGHYRDAVKRFGVGLRQVITDRHPAATVFFNGYVNADLGDLNEIHTHLEVESLPTSGGLWGYTHYPLTARYARTRTERIVGMTGRFQAAWADFGGLKPPAQLAYEIGTIVGAGGAVSIGDQLHPNGRLDAAVYRRIGAAFEPLKRVEHWWDGAQRCTEVAVLSDWHAADHVAHHVGEFTGAVAAAVQVLLELSVQVDVVDPGAADLSPYRVVIVPDGMQLASSLVVVLDEYRRLGGTVVISGTDAFDGDGRPLLADCPVGYQHPVPTTPCYIRLEGKDGDPAPAAEWSGDDHLLDDDYDYVLYDGAHQVDAAPGSTVIGTLSAAAFDRRWDHFTSHMHAPVSESVGSPLIVARDRLVYCAAGLFGAYGRHEYWVYRALIGRAIGLAIGGPILTRHGPSWIEAGVHRQQTADASRYVINLTSYQARRSAHPVPRVDAAAETAGIALTLRPNPGFVPERATIEPGASCR